jgi:hypothetical protein
MMMKGSRLDRLPIRQIHTAQAVKGDVVPIHLVDLLSH